MTFGFDIIQQWHELVHLLQTCIMIHKVHSSQHSGHKLLAVVSTTLINYNLLLSSTLFQSQIYLFSCEEISRLAFIAAFLSNVVSVLDCSAPAATWSKPSALVTTHTLVARSHLIPLVALLWTTKQAQSRADKRPFKTVPVSAPV